jgi:dTDP-4-dehydrorhamnose reductase
MKRVLILGGSGLIGKAVIARISRDPDFQVCATYFSNILLHDNVCCYKLDVGEPGSISSILNIVKPQIVVSCLRGDFKKQLSLHSIISEYLKQTSGILYYFSTTNVFDGDLSRAHYEDDAPVSQTDYGRFKIECEKTIKEILRENACILRIPQVWGKVSLRMVELNGPKEITLYPELFINTNTDNMIAKQLCYIINNGLRGAFHLAAEDLICHKEFYLRLIKNLGASPAVHDDYNEKGNFALLSKRSGEFPLELRFTNEDVINSITASFRENHEPV